MRTDKKDFALLYLEHTALRATLAGFRPHAGHDFSWYDARIGTWLPRTQLESDSSGAIRLPAFPDSEEEAKLDWAAKLLLHK